MTLESAIPNPLTMESDWLDNADHVTYIADSVFSDQDLLPFQPWYLI